MFDTETTFTSRLACRILKNKDLASTVFQEAGLNVAVGYTFRKNEKKAALQKLIEIGSAVVKPVDGNRGRGVSVNVTAESFDAAWSTAADFTSKELLLEQYFANGKDARYLVVEGSCVAVHMRIPPAIHGDGINTISELIRWKNEIRKMNSSRKKCLIEIDAHRNSIIKSQGYTLDSIPQIGQTVVIDLKAGLSTGGDARDITFEVHESMKRVAERVAHAVPGLDVVGVDILATDHSMEATPSNYIVVEANTRPMITGHQFPDFGRPINVCKMIAENCVRRMGFDIPPLGETSRMGGGKDEPDPRGSSGAATSTAATEAGRTNIAAGMLGTTAKSSAGALTLVFGGDTSLGDAYLKKAKASEHIQRLEVDPYSFFEALTPLISDKSHLIVNLETVLSTAPQGPLDGIKGHLGWDQPERTVATLKQIGTDAVSLANNHTMDYGPDKLVETISHLKEAEIDVCGAGQNIEEASYPLKLSSPLGSVYVLAGFEVRAKYRDIFNFYATEDSPGVNPFRQRKSNQISEAISNLRNQDPGSLIIVYPHWGGASNYKWATERMFEVNSSFMAAGADLVLGHGAHMVQQCYADNAGTTAFSLGNFVFNSPGRYKNLNAPPYSLVCRLHLERADRFWVGMLRLYPIVSDNRETGYRPRPVREAEAVDVYNVLCHRGQRAFREAFALDRDERGWYLARTSPLSPRMQINH